MGEDSSSVLTQFQKIFNKLKKKRILKKPNLNEAYENFEKLGAVCIQEELHQVAGVCYQNAAKCQSSLGNNINEGYLLKSAGRKFMDTELYNKRHNIVTTEDWLTSSMYNFTQAADRFENDKSVNGSSMKPAATALLLEAADKLANEFHKHDEACVIYNKVIKMFDNNVTDHIGIQTLQDYASCKIRKGNYDEALSIYNKIVDIMDQYPESGFKDDIKKDAEINRLLLLLILQPTQQQLTTSTSDVLEKYAWVDTTTNTLTDGSKTHDNLFICLQSLVISCQSHDKSSLSLLIDDLNVYFTKQQSDLLDILVS